MKKDDILDMLKAAEARFPPGPHETTTLPLKFLPGQNLAISFFASETDLEKAAEALVKLSEAPASLRQTLQLLLFDAARAAYESAKEDFDEEPTGEYLADICPAKPEDVWDLIGFSHIFVRSEDIDLGGSPSTTVEGQCNWDPEHGVGIRLDQDGNLTENPLWTG